jgi:hypothetical protein
MRHLASSRHSCTCHYVATNLCWMRPDRPAKCATPQGVLGGWGGGADVSDLYARRANGPGVVTAMTLAQLVDTKTGSSFQPSLAMSM